MSTLAIKLASFGLKAMLALYLLIAMLVGIERQRENGEPSTGSVATIMEGAAWPVTLLIDAVQRK